MIRNLLLSVDKFVGDIGFRIISIDFNSVV